MRTVEGCATPVPRVANLDELNIVFRKWYVAERDRVVQSLFGPFTIKDRLAKELAAAARYLDIDSTPAGSVPQSRGTERVEPAPDVALPARHRGDICLHLGGCRPSWRFANCQGKQFHRLGVTRTLAWRSSPAGYSASLRSSRAP